MERLILKQEEGIYIVIPRLSSSSPPIFNMPKTICKLITCNSSYDRFDALICDLEPTQSQTTGRPMLVLVDHAC